MRSLLFLSIFFLPLVIAAQPKRIVHKPQNAVALPGHRRVFHAELADIRLEANPGWQAEEINDEKDHIYQLIFSDPADTAKKIVSLLVDHYNAKDFDSAKWQELKKSIRISYGDKGIAIRPLGEKMNDNAATDSTGILAEYEILTRHKDFIEYVDAIVGKTTLVLLSAPLKTEEYQEKVPYFRDIAASIRLEKKK